MSHKTNNIIILQLCMYVQLGINMCVCMFMCECRELSIHSCFCSISFIMLRTVVVIGIGSPKGNARITVFLAFALCLSLPNNKNNNITSTLAVVPLRASERARDWAPSAVWKIYNKKSSFEVNAHFTFLYRFSVAAVVAVYAKAKFLFYALVAAETAAIDFINCCYCCCFYCFN